MIHALTDPAVTAPVTVTIAPPLPPVPLALGAWTPPPDGVGMVADYVAKFGKPPSVVHFYVDLAHPAPWLESRLDEIWAAGAMPLVSLELDDYTAGVNQPAYNNASFEGATHDAVLSPLLDRIGAKKKPLTIRPFWEFNYPGSNYPWAVGVNGNDSWSFLNAFRRTSNLIHQHVPLGRVGWSPGVSIPFGMSYDYAALYPGDAFVDVMGLDGYNKSVAGNPGGVSWTFDQVFLPSYTALTGISSRPIGFFEVGCNNVCVDRAAWLNAMGASLATPGKWKRLAFACMWNNVTGPLDCRLDGDAGTLAAYRALAANPLFAGTWK